MRLLADFSMDEFEQFKKKRVEKMDIREFKKGLEDIVLQIMDVVSLSGKASLTTTHGVCVIDFQEVYAGFEYNEDGANFDIDLPDWVQTEFYRRNIPSLD